MKKKNITALTLAVLLSSSVVACGSTVSPSTTNSDTVAVEESVETIVTDSAEESAADATTNITLVSNENTTISEAGTYTISGSVENSTIIVDAAEDAEIELILNGVDINNNNGESAILVESETEITISTLDGSINTLEISGGADDEDGGTASVIDSVNDVNLNGSGTLNITSATGTGVEANSDLKVKGGTINLDVKDTAFYGGKSVTVNDGTVNIVAGNDGIHSGDSGDVEKGIVEINGGSMVMNVEDDGIHAEVSLTVNDGTINIESCAEGLESANVVINDGDVSINASDDGINATDGSDTGEQAQEGVGIEINGGNVTVVMASGDTDALDSNGDLSINGGVVDITASSSFDANGTSTLTGGSVTVNGELVTELTSSQMGGKGPM